MSWAAKRQTTKKEDEAYSLLGLFEVNLPIIYGEGERAFKRLQEEILRAYSDQSIFAWLVVKSSRRISRHVYARQHLAGPEYADLLARSPNDFQNCRDVIPTQQGGSDSDLEYELTEGHVHLRLARRSFEYWGWKPCMSSTSLDRQTVHVVALNCCFQSEPAAIPTLWVARVESLLGTYRVLAVDCNTVDRFEDWRDVEQPMKHWLNYPRTTPERLRLVRTVSEYRGQLPLQTIFCQLMTPYYCSATVLRGEPEELWSFEKISFLLPTDGPDFSVDSPFRGQLHLQIKDEQQHWPLVLTIAAWRLETGWQCDLGIKQIPGTKLVILQWETFAQAALCLGRYWFSPAIAVEPSFHDHFIVSRRTPYINVQIYQTGIYHTTFRFFPFGLRIIFAFAVLPLGIAIPFFILRHMRQRAADILWVPVLSSAELAGLVSGSAFACLLSAWLLFDSRLYLNWKPRSWRWPTLLLLRTGWFIAAPLAGVLMPVEHTQKNLASALPGLVSVIKTLS